MARETSCGEIKYLPEHSGVTKLKDCQRLTQSMRKKIEIPHDVMVNILAALPARRVLQFRSVCKTWNSLTQEPYFAIQHAKNPPEKDNLNIIYRGLNVNYKNGFRWELDECSVYHSKEGRPFSLKYEYIYRDIGGPTRWKKYELPVDLIQKQGYPNSHTLSNSCKGLYCISEMWTVYVVNPFIEESVELPRGSPSSIKYNPFVGLGFSVSTGKYKAVRLFCRPDGVTWGCEVLVLGSHYWRDVGSFSCTCSSLWCDLPLFASEALHWKTNSSGLEIAMSFHIEHETLAVLKRPLFMKHKHLPLSEMGGELCFVPRPELFDASGPLDIWVLEDYGESKWVKKFSIGNWVGICSELENRHFDILAVAICDGKILFRQAGCNTLLYYDTKSKSLLQILPTGLGWISVHEETLVSPRALQQGSTCQSTGNIRPLSMRRLPDRPKVKVPSFSDGDDWEI